MNVIRTILLSVSKSPQDRVQGEVQDEEDGGRSGILFAHQVVQLRVFAEEGFVVSLLLVHKVLNVHIEAGRRDAFGALRGLLTFLEQQRQEGEQRVSEERWGHEHV